MGIPVTFIFSSFRVHTTTPMQSLPMRDMIAITVSSLLLRKSNLRLLVKPPTAPPVLISEFLFFRDTEYYDYGHGEAQDPSYEGYGRFHF